jgi:hypothetical protein
MSATQNRVPLVLEELHTKQEFWEDLTAYVHFTVIYVSDAICRKNTLV